jgi:AraC-like DNA-binding protein
MYRESDIDLQDRLWRCETTTRPVAALAQDYTNGASTGEHAHARAQLLFAIEGVMVVRAAAGVWVVPPSRAVWLVANLPHEVRMCGQVKMRTVFVAPDTAPTMSSSSVVAVSPLLRELILASAEMSLDGEPGARDGRVMQLLLDELETLPVLPLHLPAPADLRLRRICAGLTAAPADETSGAEWAARIGVTPRTLQRLFLSQTGLSFRQWRQQARLLYALQRLASGDRIIDVAFDCGYTSQSAFAAMFRSHFGVPPSAFYRGG